MDLAQNLLFGEFPRRVGVGTDGVDRQFWVYNEDHFNMVLNKNIGKQNVYATISSFDDALVPVTDKVSLDFDSPVKESDWGLNEIKKLKSNPGFAQSVLEPICDDIRKLGRWLEANDEPALAVYTGFGVHVHMLRESQKAAERAIKSTAWKYVERVGLDHVDESPVGDVQRILRVPNVERIQNGERTGIWTVPFTVEEMTEVTPEWLLEASSSPRSGVTADVEERPEMQEHQEYLRSDFDQPVEDVEMDVDFQSLDDEYLKTVMKELLKMPCMYERVLQPNPSHEIRRNMAVLLFNAGLGPEDVQQIIERLGWRDYDPKMTRKQLMSIYKSGYSDANCQTLQGLGLCTRTNEKCETRGWSGGRAEWKQSKL